jgi:hypothetical protein
MEKEKLAKKAQVDIRHIKVKAYQNKVLQDRAWYPARYEDAVTSPGKFGDTVRLNFVVLGGELEDGESAKGAKASTFTGSELTPNSKLMNLLRGLAGDDGFEIGDEVDLTAWYGQKFDVFVENKKGSDNTVRSNIVAVAPYHHQKKKKKHSN